MSTIRIEILNPNALKLIEGMQDLKLIKVTNEPESKLKTYLRQRRRNAISSPGLDEITDLVEEVRAERYGEK
ncbi:hypothetical protein [Olivibacter sitiensis]|uniref:hypothetical protein n=1 Tax=Olivibacter sitiensis TaxID=376470 RepID=UPI000422947A|nr:hypothetical protein [Olivibacter sitiensis]